MQFSKNKFPTLNYPQIGIKSYAQNFEDVILWRVFHNIHSGYYIDLGAQHPIYDSVSKAFYEKGWRGLHVEPSRKYVKELKIDRKDELVLPYAISNVKKPLVFYEIKDTGLSTCSKKIINAHQKNGYKFVEKIVKTISLFDVFEKIKKEIHWLKIDIEGFELQALKSWGQHKSRPWVVLIESTFPNSQNPMWKEWERYLLRRGYTFVYFDGLNRFYLHKSKNEFRKYFNVPPNIFDKFTR
jgi:FkbM family methyltransferase